MVAEKLRCFDGVVVGSTCYKLIYRVGVGVNHEKARRLCTFHGGALAEIPTEEVYNAVFDYVKTNWYIDLNHQESSFVRVWLGSSYDVSTLLRFCKIVNLLILQINLLKLNVLLIKNITKAAVGRQSEKKRFKKRVEIHTL